MITFGSLIFFLGRYSGLTQITTSRIVVRNTRRILVPVFVFNLAIDRSFHCSSVDNSIGYNPVGKYVAAGDFFS